MTPTIPLPAPTRSLSLGMYEKSWVNELMLRSDGTTAGDAVAVLLPPQAIATIPTTPILRPSLANLIWFYLLSKWHLSPSSRECPGRECAGEQALLRTHGGTAPAPRRACLTPTRLSRVRWCDPHNLFKLLTNPGGRP